MTWSRVSQVVRVVGPLAIVIGLVSVALDRNVWWLSGRLPFLVAAGMAGAVLPLLWPTRPDGGPAPSVFSGRVAAEPLASGRQDRDAPTHLIAEVLCLPKLGGQAAECEDAFAGHGETGTYAVADGASDSFEARSWAQVLADRFVESPPAPLAGPDVAAWLQDARGRWQAQLDEAASPATGSRWWLDGLREKGAFATLLGVRLSAGDEGVRWEATAVGDSCLVQVSHGRVVASFPIDRYGAFTSSPPLLASFGLPGGAVASGELAQFRWATGSLDAGDTLLLLTDAIANWTLASTDDVAQLFATGTWDAVEKAVGTARLSESFPNDDVTVLRIRTVI
jgi:Protein phosphatase 2C